MYLTFYVLAFILFTLIAYYYFYQTMECFFDFGSRIDCPTRNQSYDLRGDEYVIPHRNDFVWLNSEFGSINPQQCPRRRLMEIETMI
uniref:Uncharacterized protein n=1 Tax=viral metagenome TaxID=1070528 RepID=A0A6C0CTX8_9ZZZZ